MHLPKLALLPGALGGGVDGGGVRVEIGNGEVEKDERHIVADLLVDLGEGVVVPAQAEGTLEVAELDDHDGGVGAALDGRVREVGGAVEDGEGGGLAVGEHLDGLRVLLDAGGAAGKLGGDDLREHHGRLGPRDVLVVHEEGRRAVHAEVEASLELVADRVERGLVPETLGKGRGVEVEGGGVALQGPPESDRNGGGGWLGGLGGGPHVLGSVGEGLDRLGQRLQGGAKGLGRLGVVVEQDDRDDDGGGADEDGKRGQEVGPDGRANGPARGLEASGTGCAGCSGGGVLSGSVGGSVTGRS